MREVERVCWDFRISRDENKIYEKKYFAPKFFNYLI